MLRTRRQATCLLPQPSRRNFQQSHRGHTRSLLDDAEQYAVRRIIPRTALLEGNGAPERLMRSVTVAAILIAAGCGPAWAQSPAWLTDPRSGCSVWDPLPVPDEIIGWTGGCNNGKAAGPGTLTIFRDGQLVERNDGEFVDGKQTGHGTRAYPNGRYVGHFKDGLFDGTGIYEAAEGMRYDGEFKNGNLDGHGTLTSASGLRYEGQFRLNAYNGFGSMLLPDGARYDGEYVRNTPHGTGVYKSADGSVYAGQWIHGCFTHDGQAAYLLVFPEDCGLSAEATTAMAASPDRRDSRQN